MKTTFTINNSKDISFTMKITMPLSQWKEISDQLSDAHPSWKLSSAINQVIISAEQVFYAEDKGLS